MRSQKIKSLAQVSTVVDTLSFFISRQIAKMDQLGGAGHPECVDDHSLALRAHRARRHVLLDDGDRVPRDDQDVGQRVPALLGVVELRRAEGGHQRADHQQPHGLDQDGHTGPPLHHPEQPRLLGHIESRRGRLSGHLSDQDFDHGHLHGHHTEAQPTLHPMDFAHHFDHWRCHHSDSKC